MAAATGCRGGDACANHSSSYKKLLFPRVPYANHISLVGRILRSSPFQADRLMSTTANSTGRRPQDPSVSQQLGPADPNPPNYQQYDLPSSRSNGTAQPAGWSPQESSASDPYRRPAYSDSPAPDQSTTQPSSLNYQAPPSSYALQRMPQPPVLLSFYDALKGKDIITTAEGTNLGKAEGAIVDSSTMTLEAITVAENSSSSSTSGFCIPTATLSQVGDVILISEERAMRRPPAVPEFVSLLGTHVRSARGQYIGRINDVDFDPDTGAISAIFYDEYGLSWLPLSMQLVNLYGVPTEAVLEVTREEVVIDDRSVWLAMPGKVEGLGKALKGLKLVGGEGDSPVVVAARQSRQLEQWEETYGMTAGEWLERYGQVDREPRERRGVRSRLPEPSSRAPPRTGAPSAYQQRRKARDSVYAGRGSDPRRPERPRAEPAQRRMQQPAAGGARRQPQPEAPRQSRQATPGRAPGGRPDEETQARRERPAYGSVLQPDPRAPQFEDARQPLLERRGNDAMRSDQVF